jgi:hypothetical protein
MRSNIHASCTLALAPIERQPRNREKCFLWISIYCSGWQGRLARGCAAANELAACRSGLCHAVLRPCQDELEGAKSLDRVSEASCPVRTAQTSPWEAVGALGEGPSGFRHRVPYQARRMLEMRARRRFATSKSSGARQGMERRRQKQSKTNVGTSSASASRPSCRNPRRSRSSRRRRASIRDGNKSA